MSRFIDQADIQAIATGAAVLGTGGGGDPYVGSLIARRAIREHGPVQLLDVDDLPAEAFVVPIGGIGAPSVSIEKIMAISEIDLAIDALEQAVGRRATAIMPIEVGGGNSMLPLAAAAMRGLPLVDGDAMGRAFPEASMVTFHLAGYGPGVTVLVDAFGNVTVSRPVDGLWSERLARALTVEMGGSATMIDYAYGGDVVAECAIRGTITLAQQIGQILHDKQRPDERRVDDLLSAVGGFRLFTGKVADVHHRVDGGFTKGSARLDGTGVDKGASASVDFQNEMLLARRGERVLASAPDLICLLDEVTGMPITTESVRYGARVTIIAIPCDPNWRTVVGLATAGPAAFGYDVPFVPVEQAVRA